MSTNFKKNHLSVLIRIIKEIIYQLPTQLKKKYLIQQGKNLFLSTQLTYPWKFDF